MSDLRRLAALGLVLASGMGAAAEDGAVDKRYTWDLTELYPTEAAWNEAREEVMASLDEIEARRGTLGDSADALYETHRLVSDTLRKGGRVFVYASLEADEDLRDTSAQERRQLAQIMYARFTESTAWIQPELLAVGREVVESYVAEDERLAPFAFQLDDALRNAPHTLGEEAEQTLAYFTQTFGSPTTVYDMISNSDIPWPTVTLADGTEVRLDSQGYELARSSENRGDRKLAFDEFWGTWQEYRNSVGLVLNSHIQTQVALAKARHYDSVLERELFSDNLPPAVYRTLVKEVNDALPTLHRYFRLRGRMLGVEQMQYYDIYPPLVSLDLKFDVATSKTITLAAMEVLGEDWVRRQSEAMDERWMHVYPQRGKQVGRVHAGLRLRRASLSAAQSQRRLRVAVDHGARMGPRDAYAVCESRTSHSRRPPIRLSSPRSRRPPSSSSCGTTCRRTRRARTKSSTTSAWHWRAFAAHSSGRRCSPNSNWHCTKPRNAAKP